MHHRSRIVLLLAAAAIACCARDEATGPDPSQAAPPISYPEKAVVHWAPFGSWGDDMIRQAAEAEMLILPIDWCFSPESRRVIEEIRRLHPSTKIIGYRTLMSVCILRSDTTYLREAFPYTLDYYNAVRSDWAWTTEQDTVLLWPDIIMLDPIENGAPNRSLIDTMVDLIATYRDRTGAIDGIMHDYFMYSAYLNPLVRETMIGEVDFDEDGIRHTDDADERALFNEWQKEYARAIHERLGDDFIQIGNGRPPQENAELAGLLNGIFYELYPNNPWWGTDRAGLLRLLENQQTGYLRPACGRTWSVCTNEKGNSNDNNRFCLFSSLLAGCMYTELQGSYVFTGWTLDLDPGAPIGSTAVEGAMDSILTVRRAFLRGEVRISFEPSGRRQQTAFEPLD